MRRVLALLLVTAVTSAVAACGGHPAAAPRPSSPSSPATPATSSAAPGPYAWYLSLGDSLAFGYQEATFRAQKAANHADPAAYDTGFADVITAALRQRVPALVTANLGCAAETTVTYLHGGCPAQDPGLLHVPYTGSQAAAVDGFLQPRTGRGLVTVALGANDAIEVLESCPDDSVACVLPKLLPALATMKANLTAILADVRRRAPAATVVVLLDYDPFVKIDANARRAVDLLDGDIADAARATGAVTVDARPTFDPAGMPDTICRLTAICGPLQDIHPTDEGYRLLAGLFLAAAGVR